MEKNIFELLLDKGISSIPVNSDKKPLVAWKEFQNRLPSQEECKKLSLIHISEPTRPY